MSSYSYKVIGVIFLLAAGLIYTFERIFSILSVSIIKAGFLSGQVGGELPEVDANIFNNLFVPLFLLISGILLFFGFTKQKD